MTVSVAVMAHPKRAEMVADLLDRLDRPAKVIWDERQDRHDTGLRAIEAFDPSCDHHLVIQDDVLPCRDLVAGVERALVHVPDLSPASFYIGRVQPFRRRIQQIVTRAEEGASWVTMDGVYWGPAIAYPTRSIVALSEWYRSNQARHVTNYDRRVSRWFERGGWRCWYSWPSLVDHRGDASLVRASKAVRRAHRFIGADVSALDVDWSGPVVDLANSSKLDRERQRRAAR